MPQKEQMKMRFKSVVFDQTELVKSYKQDFSSTGQFSKKWEWNNPFISGTMRDFQVDGALISIEKITPKKKYVIETHYPSCLMKLHFEIKGNRHCIKHSSSEEVTFSEGDFNLSYYPELYANNYFSKEPRLTIAIFFNKKVLEQVAGDDVSFLSPLKKACNQKKTATLWPENQVISNELLILLYQIINCDLPERLKKSFLEAKVKEILVLVLSKAVTKVPLQPEVPLNIKDFTAVTMVEKYIRKNLKKQLTIAQLAQLAGCNTSKLKQEFKQVFEITIFKHITQLRMQKAKSLILEKNYTIAQASYEVGYKNAQHFTVAFKKKYGFLPKELKN